MSPHEATPTNRPPLGHGQPLLANCPLCHGQLELATWRDGGKTLNTVRCRACGHQFGAKSA